MGSGSALRPRGLRDRRLQPVHRGLADIRRWQPTLPWTRWRCRCGRARAISAGSCTIPTREPIHRDPLHRAPGRGRHRAVGRLGRRFLRQCHAESVVGLYTTEVIRRTGPWNGIGAVEYATLEWEDWFNHRRLLEPIGHARPRSSRPRTGGRGAQRELFDSTNPASGEPGLVHSGVSNGAADLAPPDGCVPMGFRRHVPIGLPRFG